MQRSSFLKLALASFSWMAAPFTLYAKRVNVKTTGKGFMVNAGKDRFNKSLSLFDGDTFFCKVSTADSGGNIYVFESAREKEGGPALHYHYEQDEWWYVLQGEFLIRVGDETYHAKAGDSVFGPRMVPHAFSKTGAGEARLLMFYQPAGKMEEFFRAVGNGAMKGMSARQQDDFRKAHGFERVGPPIDRLKL